MSLEKKLQAKYGRDSYQRAFSKDFREAVKGMDSISKVVCKAVRKKEEEK